MQLGFVSAILPDRSLEEVARFAGQEGFDCVELMCWPAGKAERRYAGVTHVDVARLDAGEARRVSDFAQVALPSVALVSTEAIERLAPSSGSLSLASSWLHRFGVVASSLTATSSSVAAGASLTSATWIVNVCSTARPSGSVARATMT